jgi:pilus assembly protein Flp/PilA
MKPKILKNQNGQGLVEYLIIVALMGVATIAIVRTMNEVVTKRFASVTAALQGDKYSEKATIDESTHRKKDMGDFLNGVGGQKRGRDAGE